MFSSLFDAARNSPFKGPLTVANCEAAAAAPGNGDSCEFGSNKYFLLCGLGGIISCGKCQKIKKKNFLLSNLLCNDILSNEELFCIKY